MPDLPIAPPFVEAGDQRRAGFNHAIDRVRMLRQRPTGGGDSKIERGREVQQPDRLEIGAEKRTRWAERVVAVRPAEVARGVGGEDIIGARGSARVVQQKRESRGTCAVLRSPEMAVHQPPFMVHLIGVHRSACRARVRVRTARIEDQKYCALNAATCLAGEP